MRTRNLSIILLIIFFLSACNLPSGAEESSIDTPAEFTPTLENENTLPPPTATLTPIPSATPLPSDTPLPPITNTPTVPIALPKDINVNCRLGYGIEWAVIGALLEGQPATIIAKNATASWWYVSLADASATKCWVASTVTSTAGNLAGLPVYNQSIASVTKVTIEKPATISVPGCVGAIQPLNLKGTIEMNGPGTVSWHFESEQSGILTDHATDFAEAGSKTVTDSFVPPVDEESYWIKLIAFLPNEKVAETSYKIECP